MYDSRDLRKGLKIEIDGDPYVVVQFQFAKPGKGKSYYKCKQWEFFGRHGRSTGSREVQRETR